MSSTDRQNRLLLTEDWKKVYQSFRNAEFKSYDFDSLRRTMIQYLRNNYPEDFNDYIESSEYLALIDVICFLGQNLAFRADLNARENYLELAERRESILRLARLLAYNPKRNQAANGLIKFESVSTSEEITDSNGTNLGGQTIIWNDPSNNNWKEQFTRVLNAALPLNNTVGKPAKSQTINSILTQQYRFNSASSSNVPIFSFSKAVGGVTTRFEMVSTDINVTNKTIEEEPPLPGNNLAFLYREDGRGNGSANTGYFLHFRQGTLEPGDFEITNPSSNQSVALDSANINNTDVWLFSLNNAGSQIKQWTPVTATEGNNAIYNSVVKGTRNIYALQTRQDDKVNLVFADGTFGNIPQGNLRVYYRTSANRSMKIVPSELTNINFTLDYISKAGNLETLTVGVELKEQISNASGSETNASIKSNAPQTYYTQNRMITGEDYNITPLSISQEIVKVKATNRTSSGISRYFDLRDSTGKYSNTNIYGSDGIIYRENFTNKFSFSFVSQTDIEGVIENSINPKIQNRAISNFYYSNYAKIIVSDLQASWVQSTKQTNSSTGYLKNANNVSYQVGTYTGGSLKYIEAGALVKFVPPAGFYFTKEGTLTSNGSGKDVTAYKWVKVVSVNGAGTSVDATTNVGPIVFNGVVPATAIIEEIKPKLVKTLTSDVKTQLIDQVFAYKTFGLRYDQINRQWRVIISENLDTTSSFSNGKGGDVTNNALDASWLLLFETNGEKYTVTNRGLRYVFESDKEISFYYDNNNKIYDTTTGLLVKDKIGVLNFNTKPDLLTAFNADIDWEIVGLYKNQDGYVNSKKVEVSFYDVNDDGSIDDPDVFDIVVAPGTNVSTKYIFLKKELTSQGYNKFNYFSNSENGTAITVKANEAAIGSYSSYTDGTVFYLIEENVFKILNSTASILSLSSDYIAYLGRSGLKFHYIHSANESNRIDPSSTNIIDVFMLTKTYNLAYRQYLAGALSTQPLPPSSDSLFLQYGQDINKVKSISDEVIYHPVIYKPLFGVHAEENLQATFKIVKNPSEVVNDNDVKARVISAINQFFTLQNWDFGDTFHFAELVGYVMQIVSPDVVNLVIVPKKGTLSYGSLHEIKCEDNEIFVSDATVDDVEVIDSITASRLQATGTVISTSSRAVQGIQSTRSTATTSTATSTTTTASTSSSSSSSSSGSSGSGGSGSSGGGGGSSGGGGGSSGGGGGSSGGGGGYGY